MKTLRSILAGRLAVIHAAVMAGLLAIASPAVAAESAAKPASQVSMQSRFKQVQERVGALYQNRNQPPPPVDPRYNPFRAPGTAPVAPPVVSEGDTGPRPPGGAELSGPAPGASLGLLQQGAATLKVSGIFEISGRAHLVINSRPYKEGDVVQTLVQGETVYLRVKEISKRSVTLSLNDAEMTLKF